MSASQSSQSSQSRFILNMTEGTFFVSKDYEKILITLFEKDFFGTSRWLRSDKIVFVPEHLFKYVSLTYERIFPKI